MGLPKGLTNIQNKNKNKNICTSKTSYNMAKLQNKTIWKVYLNMRDFFVFIVSVYYIIYR